MTEIQGMWRTFNAWLHRPQITDPVDRRNAPMLQIVLMLLGTLPPLLWLHRIVGTDIAWRPGETTSLLASMFISAMAVFCLVLVRRGRFQWAVRQLLVVVAAMLLVAYAGGGLSAQTYEQPIQVMWLFVAGVMVGRRALWAMYAVLAAALFIGATVEAGRLGEPPTDLWPDAVIRSTMFLLIAVVVDRSVAALRGSLDEATRRGRELSLANARLEEEIAAREHAQEQLIHAQKVEAVGRMASGVAHDFNHLLTLILGYAERGRLAESREELQEAVHGMESAARRASAITHKLLNFSRYDITRPERFDAVEAIREMGPMLKQTLGAGIALKMDLPATACPIVFDRAQFGLVVLNLTANAAQAMPNGGRFHVTVNPLATGESTEAVEIALRDTGPGITPEIQSRMFEPFFTTKPSGQGTGLGLAIVSNLVSEAGGTIQVQSGAGEGTTFRLRLPVANARDVQDPARNVA